MNLWVPIRLYIVIWRSYDEAAKMAASNGLEMILNDVIVRLGFWRADRGAESRHSLATFCSIKKRRDLLRKGLKWLKTFPTEVCFITKHRWGQSLSLFYQFHLIKPLYTFIKPSWLSQIQYSSIFVSCNGPTKKANARARSCHHLQRVCSLHTRIVRIRTASSSCHMTLVLRILTLPHTCIASGTSLC